MSLQSQLTALKNQSRDLSLVERARLSCLLAKQFEKAGEYEAAAEALAEFWPDRYEPPKLDGLDESMKAEVLLRVGALAGLQGSADQVVGSQEMAKDVITKGIEIFESLGQSEKGAEAHADLALCYWREGAFDEARIHLAQALESLKNDNSDLKACVLIRAGTVELRAGRLNEALRFYGEAAPLIENSEDSTLKGAFHNQLATLYENFGTRGCNNDFTDRALIEYTAASFHFEQACNFRYLARVENNLGFLFLTIGRYKDAHSHLDRARQLFLELKDVGTVAQVDDTRARTLLGEGRLQEAERFARSAVKTLEKGDEQALLAEALTTHGIALARLGNHSPARALFQRAIEVAETAGDLEGAGRAKLSIIEELSEQTSAPQLASAYQSAADLLQHSQDPAANKRLISCARKVIHALGAVQREDQEAKERSWEGFSLRQEIRKSEKAIIERALRDAGGAVTKAARLLGFNHHQSLISVINSRHPDLLKTRSAVRKRRRHLFSQPKTKIKWKLPTPAPKRSTSQICILHVEDNEFVARTVSDLLTAENWKVELCVDGDSALRKLTGNDPYDLILVDNNLPGLSGLELAQRARKITHRRRTPIVMLSGNDYETEAWRAGVDAFLKKPEQISELPSTITRLLKEGSRHT